MYNQLFHLSNWTIFLKLSDDHSMYVCFVYVGYNMQYNLFSMSDILQVAGLYLEMYFTSGLPTEWIL
jgi:hypothetical protein